MSRRSVLALLFLLCGNGALSSQTKVTSALLEARHDFHTRLLRKESIGEAAETPPSGVLELVHYPAALGSNAAYVSSRPADGKKHPAVIWLVGGFSNSVGAIAWTPGPKSNDQSASGFRDAGVLMMYPGLRGGNDNPGCIETFYGEVDDVLTAAKFLASLDYVDSSRIYLGGHSTGGTLALLVAAAAGDRFRAVFALGAVDDVIGYGADVLPFDLNDSKEAQLRAPRLWLTGIQCPTFLFEGTKAPSNIASLHTLRKQSTNPLLHFSPVPGETHFSVIAPMVERLARAVRRDGQECRVFTLVDQ